MTSTSLMKRVASAGVLLGPGGVMSLPLSLPLPAAKKPCLEYLGLGGGSLQPPQHPQVVPQAYGYHAGTL